MEGIALVGVFIAISMLLRWLVVHDREPEGKTHGLFAIREPGDAQPNQILLASRLDPQVTPRLTQPVISFTPPTPTQNRT